MKIGIDLDDVIVEFSRRFLNFYNQRNKTKFRYENWVKYHFSDSFGLERDIVNYFADEFFNSPLLYDLRFVRGSKNSLRDLSKKNELCIVTSRPLRHKERTDDFIRKTLSDIPIKVFYSDDFHKQHSIGKAGICQKEGIDLIIEDNGDYALYCLDKGINAIILKKKWNLGYSNGIIRANNWNEILNKINELNKAK